MHSHTMHMFSGASPSSMHGGSFTGLKGNEPVCLVYSRLETIYTRLYTVVVS